MLSEARARAGNRRSERRGCAKWWGRRLVKIKMWSERVWSPGQTSGQKKNAIRILRNSTKRQVSGAVAAAMVDKPR